jgi:hypothetical protein
MRPFFVSPYPAKAASKTESSTESFVDVASAPAVAYDFVDRFLAYGGKIVCHYY